MYFAYLYQGMSEQQLRNCLAEERYHRSLCIQHGQDYETHDLRIETIEACLIKFNAARDYRHFAAAENFFSQND